MHRIHLDFPAGWRQASRTSDALAATMVLQPGESEGGPDNFHPQSDQWIFVVAGDGVAIVDGEEQALRPGVLLRIDRGERHELRNTGSGPLQALSLYVPPLAAS
ncbi:MAG TPA: cupin domain-containing protein [Longimicrobium sp.]|nr:cupin domain-containing protein [Longimicrobium sp.]